MLQHQFRLRRGQNGYMKVSRIESAQMFSQMFIFYIKSEFIILHYCAILYCIILTAYMIEYIFNILLYIDCRDIHSCDLIAVCKCQHSIIIYAFNICTS